MPIAVVLATSEELARRAAKKISLDIQTLEPSPIHASPRRTAI
jgi:xanthine dehydrogenase molybdopterin-binding subunit B